MTCAYMPDGATYNGKPHRAVLSKDTLKRLEAGDLIDNENDVPLLYSRK